MTDTEKERELPEEGMEMTKESLGELGEKKESSLAADQESVTGKNNSNNSINGSSKEVDGSSINNEPHETSKDDTTGDPPPPKVSDKREVPDREDQSESTLIVNKEKGEEEQPSQSETTGSGNSLSDTKPNITGPSSDNDSPEQEEALETETHSSETEPHQSNETAEESKSTEKEISDIDKIQKKEEPQDANGVPQVIEGEPPVVTESQDVEAKVQDVKEVPQDVKEVPQDVKEVPQDVETEPQDVEAEVQDVKEVPQDVKEVPQDVKEVPQDVKEVPQDVETEPQDVETEPQSTKAEPQFVVKESEDVKEEPQNVVDEPQVAGKDPEIEAKAEKNKAKAEKNIDKTDQVEGSVTLDSPGPEEENQEKSSDAITKTETEEGTDKSEEKKDETHLEDELVEEEEKDYSLLKKDELINEFEILLKIDDIKLAEKKIKELKPFYQEIVESEKKEALRKFMDDGSVEIDFKYIGDALDSRYANLNDKYKGRRNAYYSELEKSKEENLTRKQDILEKLRAIVDGEETNASISALKNITNEWRSIGPVPSVYAKSMWATYNILIDRFYDNRSIYFELKELDRKKNLESKLELCEKAEHLLEYDVIRDAVKELNELHEEFKHIGPVPKEMQEVVWQRFKSASDAIYNRRKDYVSGLKKELHENLDAKKQLVEDVAKFDEFDSDKISDWNEKTKEILDLQKKWEAIGGLPREHAKEVNKHFWSSFKSFFNNKNKFFKKLESQRDENLLKKEDLVKRAEGLKESSDWEKTAEQLKELQREWKDIGPIPEKNRNEVYKKFKKACDTFFNKRREHSKEVESEYKVNLRKKDEICVEIEKMVQEKVKDMDRFKELQVLFNGIGFVPRNTIKKIQKKYKNATELFLNSFDLSDTEKSELRFAAEVDKLKASPNADKRIYRKEVEVRRLISKIENDIALWKNNIEFFAKSKTADKVREEFNEKIAKATAQLEELKEELKVLNKI